jgi:hypothetical protein
VRRQATTNVCSWKRDLITGSRETDWSLCSFLLLLVGAGVRYQVERSGHVLEQQEYEVYRTGMLLEGSCYVC